MGSTLASYHLDVVQVLWRELPEAPTIANKRKGWKIFMLVKDFLSVCDFMPNKIVDRCGHIYFSNGIKYAHYEEMEIHEVRKTNAHITIYLDTYGYDGEYESKRI